MVEHDCNAFMMLCSVPAEQIAVRVAEVRKLFEKKLAQGENIGGPSKRYEFCMCCEAA